MSSGTVERISARSPSTYCGILFRACACAAANDRRSATMLAMTRLRKQYRRQATHN
jgi:hypothetical protein